MMLDRAAQKLEPEKRNLRQHNPLIRDSVCHHHVERADPVGRDYQKLIAQVINVPHLAPHRFTVPRFSSAISLLA